MGELTIEELQDYPALLEVQRALWHVGETRGAAVMVGAGFSRYAELPASTSPHPPLWVDFCNEMRRRLYPHGDGPADPLRLAEEFRAALGQAALDGLIRDLVPDDAWTPSDHHRNLLRLPWSDVLTTNWDTLLERARFAHFDRTYEVVRTPADIASTRAPRIVKLHGSLPSHKPFIFAEEDYRTYPKEFAPFVNLAQQVLLENELCLIGFSGDDPNFLAWSGWVRDHLGKSARPIRLAGVLNLSPPRRRYLENLNVTPIDLAPLVQGIDDRDRQHRRATNLLLESFRAAEPRPLHVWARQTVDVYAPRAEETPEARLTAMAQLWRRERKAYPGWLLPPWQERLQLRMHTEPHISRTREDLPNVPPTLRGEVLRELVWRFEISLWGYPEWLQQALAAASADPTAHGLERTGRLTVLGALTRAARERRDRAAFDDYRSRLANEGDEDIEVAATVAYETCIWARDELDYNKLIEHHMQVQGSDPAWLLRRASLLCELKDYKAAARLIRDCLAQVRERRTRDRRSLWLLSREAWAHWLIGSAWFELREHESPIGRSDETWPTNYAVAQCDPWHEFAHLDRETRETTERTREAAVEEITLFDAGELQTRSSGSWHSDYWLRPHEELRRLADHVGLPLAVGHSDIVGSRMSRAVQAARDSTPAGIWAVVLALKSHSGGLIDQRFNRIEVARLPDARLGELIERLRASVEFGRPRLWSGHAGNDKVSSAWVEPMRVHVELLSRLVVRLTTERALETFRWATTLAHDPQWTHWWLYSPLHHLLRRSLKAIPAAERQTAVFDVLQLPLPAEKDSYGNEDHWPELFDLISPDAVQITRGGNEWDRRILELIDGVRATGLHSRTCAILRLSLLHRRNLLTIAEQQSFAAALWAQRDTPESLPSVSNLYPNIFLELPEPETGTAEKAFEHEVVHQLTSGSHSERAVRGLAQACDETGAKYPLVTSDALAIFDHLTRPSSESSGSRDDSRRHQDPWLRHQLERQQQASAYALANAVLSAVSAADLGGKRIGRLFEILRTGEWPSLVVVLPKLSELLPDRYADAVTLVRRGLAGRHFEMVAPAMDAVRRWLLSHRANFPAILATDITGLCAVRREPGLHLALRLARELVEQGLMSEPDQDRLIDSLEFLFVETAYDNWRAGDLRTETLTLVRANCVRLAYALGDRGRCNTTLKQWLSEAPGDPMPEVRQALMCLED